VYTGFQKTKQTNIQLLLMVSSKMLVKFLCSRLIWFELENESDKRALECHKKWKVPENKIILKKTT
jgi:hypothetical protein